MSTIQQKQPPSFTHLIDLLSELRVTPPPQASHKQLLSLFHTQINGQIPFFRAALKPLDIWTQVASIVDLTTKSPLGYNVLHFAALWGKTEVIRDLLKRNLNPNEPDSHYNTPLHYAASLAQKDSIQALLEAQADPTLKNLDGKTPKEVAQEKLSSTKNLPKENFEQIIQLL